MKADSLALMVSGTERGVPGKTTDGLSWIITGQVGVPAIWGDLVKMPLE